LKRSNRLVLLIGVFLAVIAFVGIALLLSGGGGGGGGGPTPPPTQLPTVIATRDINLGVTVTADMVTSQMMDVGNRKATAFGDPSQVIGQIARRPIKANAQLEAADFATGDTGCGTITVPAGMRAISVQVDQVSGVGTVINTGDYTDLLVGFTGDKFPVVTVNPQDQSISVVSGPASQRAPIRVAPRRNVPGSITVSPPISTSTSISVLAGSTIVTPASA